MTTASTSSARSADLQESLFLLNQRFPERAVEVNGSVVSYRTCGSGPAIVLLHGIGSGAASWLPCALRLAEEATVIAWNAPGYGASSMLSSQSPTGTEYAARLEQLLAALGIEQCVLVGHSLGAIMAAAYVASGTTRISRLVLISPAQGYGSEEKRARGEAVAQERMTALQTLGIAGMAEHRSRRMLSENASDAQRAWVRWNMQQLHPEGYTQAVHLLCGDDIYRYARRGMPGAVYCGSADAITTPQDSRELAREIELPFALIDGAGHACYVEQADAVASAILENSTSNQIQHHE
ncbi:alpha/beta fold hydrolase [Noviherbaspirillum saxi]|uniref:Alpha/beta hydrolase n=1 Tax=Noviherbaspirillum saxi TaxID=2320863 RepID=A0A3A3FIL1_9BURK|nr:alpha/beta hydrolase [Noviherbaspirillum saxi]RJF92228.1 alpha/beta hydrolase [Noviherbaspirillum saxi]